MTKQRQSYEDGTALRNGTAFLLESLKTNGREKDSQLFCGATRPELSRVATSAARTSRRATSVRSFRDYSGMSYGVQFYGTPAFVQSDEYSALLQRIRSKRMHSLNGNTEGMTTSKPTAQVTPHRSPCCGGVHDEKRRQLIDFMQSVLGPIRKPNIMEQRPMPAPCTLNTSVNESISMAACASILPFCTGLALAVSRGDRPSWLARAWNKIMHSINGNPPKQGAKRPTKKKSATVKKATRARRNGKLTAQADFIKSEASAGNARARALAPVIRGRGDYNIGRDLGSQVGGFLGSKIHAWISQIFGSGDYELHAPQSMPQANSLVARDTMPSFGDGKGGMVIEFNSFVGTFPGTTSFHVQTFPLDATSSLTFPWSYIIARRFQQYEMDGCVIFVTSLISEMTTAIKLGSYYGSARYDVDSKPPASKREVMNSLFCHTDKASRNQVFAIECAPDATQVPILKVRQPGTSSGDEQFYKLGFFDLCCDGLPADVDEAVDVNIAFRFKFGKPWLRNNSGFLCFMADIYGNTGEPLTYIADTANVKQPRVNNIGISVDPTLSRIYFPFDAEVGAVYFISVQIMNENAANAGFWTQSNLLYCHLVDSFRNQNSSTAISQNSGTNTGCFYSMATVAIMIDAGSSLNTPPHIDLNLVGTGADSLGNLMVYAMDPAVASGLQALPPQQYMRQEFIDYLFAVDVDDEKFSGRVPDLRRARLVDYVEAFRKDELIDANMVERSKAKYDTTHREALEVFRRFDSRKRGIVRARVRPPRLDVYDGDTEDFVVTSHINGNNGSYTGTDDVKEPDGVDLNGSYTGTDDVEDSDGKVLVETLSIGVPSGVVHESAFNAMVAFREKTGWSKPAAGLFFYRQYCVDPRTVLTNEKGYFYSPRPVVKTKREIARSICQAHSGVVCLHAYEDCYGGVAVEDHICKLANHSRNLLGAFILGANGEATNKDDVFLQCAPPCQRGHYHLVVRGALSGARRRRREGQAPDRPPAPKKYVRCPARPCALPVHFHANSSSDGEHVVSRQEALALLVEESVDRTLQTSLGAEDAAIEQAQFLHEQEQQEVADISSAPAQAEDATPLVSIHESKNSQPMIHAPLVQSPYATRSIDIPSEIAVSEYKSEPDQPPLRLPRRARRTLNRVPPPTPEIAPIVFDPARFMPEGFEYMVVLPEGAPADPPRPGDSLAGYNRAVQFALENIRQSEEKYLNNAEEDYDAYVDSVTQENRHLGRLYDHARTVGVITGIMVCPNHTPIPPRVWQDQYHSLLSRRYHLEEEGTGNSATAPPDVPTFSHTCPVCFEILQPRNVIALSCDHLFCARCVYNVITGSQVKCPLCRRFSNLVGDLEHTHEMGITLLVAANGPEIDPRSLPIVDDGPPEDSGPDSSSSDDDPDDPDEGDDEEQPEPWPIQPQLLVEDHKDVDPWRNTLQNIQRARQLNDRFLPRAERRVGPGFMYARARTPYPLPARAIYGVRHRVSVRLTTAIEALVDLWGRPGPTYRSTPRSSHGAPPAPPFGVAIIGGFDVMYVTIFSTIDPNMERGIGYRVLRQASRLIPFLHLTDEHYDLDPPTANTVTIDQVHFATTGEGHRWAFWRPDHQSPVAGTPHVFDALTAIAASVFKGARHGFVYSDLFAHLQTTQDVRLLNLNSRAAAETSDGQFKMREVFVAAVRRCANAHPNAPILMANSIDYFDNTIQFYAQQQFFRSVNDQLATGPRHGLDFRVGPRSHQHWTTVARTE